MTAIPWYIAAAGAAVLWGIHYPLLDHALKKVSLPTVLLLTALPVMFLVPLFHQAVSDDYRTLVEMPWRERLFVLALAVTSLAATVLLFLSIGAKNATFASIIEISYPLFVALFAYLLFRDGDINSSVILGGALIMAGVTVIAFGNR